MRRASTLDDGIGSTRSGDVVVRPPRGPARRALVALAATLSLALGAFACTSSVDEGPGSRYEPEVADTERFAVVTLTYGADAGARVRDELLAQAWFVEHRGFERGDVLAFLGVPAAARVDSSLPVDHCEVDHRDLLDDFGGADADAAPTQVRLLDAGEVMLDVESRATFLDASYFPDVFRTVSGLSYAGVLQNTGAFEAAMPGELTVIADGSDEVGPFQLTLAPPAPMHLATVGRAPATRARAWSGGDLAVSWEAQPELDPGIVVLTYVRRGFDQMATVTCVARDDGTFSVPEAALASLPVLGDDQADQLVIQRLTAEPFAAPGVSDGMAFAIAQDAVFLD